MAGAPDGRNGRCRGSCEDREPRPGGKRGLEKAGGSPARGQAEEGCGRHWREGQLISIEDEVGVLR